MYVTLQWIQYIINFFQDEVFFSSDFRWSSANSFSTLAGFCELANKVITDNLITFSLNQYVSTTVTPVDLFNSQVQVLVDQFKSSITNTFIISLNAIRSTTQSNGLYSALVTNYQLVILPGSASLARGGYSYSNCSCIVSAKCLRPFPIFNYPNTTPIYTVPGMYRGCFIVEALLQSNLQCFYDRNCLNQLQSYFISSTSINLTSLDSSLSTHYSINSTIEQLLDELMIEQWNISITYKNYYDECQPKECSYIHEAKNSIVYVITALIGLLGGLITILRLIIPRLVTLVKKYKETRRIENVQNPDELSRSLIQKLKQYLITLNLFESIPPTTDQHQLRNQKISTRIFIFFLLSSLIILFLYNSLITIIQTSTIPNPTYDQYLQHYSLYSQSLTCPCTKILTNYDTFLHIDYTLHQVCTSMYVTLQWIQYIINFFQDEVFFSSDFRWSSANSFSTLAGFCELANKVITDNLITFSLNQYVSTTVTPVDLFNSQVQVLVDQFKSSITNTFIISLNAIRSTTQSNGLYSALVTNYQLVILPGSASLARGGYSYSNCSCIVSAKCLRPFPIFNYPNTTPIYTVPGMYRGCFIVEALLQSNLQCFYDRNCLNQLQSYFISSTSINLTSLDSSLSTHYSINSTIEQLLDELMIEQWNISITYKNYYDECQPKECSYIHEAKNSIVYVITALIGLVGGLIKILKIVIPTIVKLIDWIVQK
ncbi:unnamed protein product [Adineta ricciae]|nr:unnamed protein product [Adineta ricciae]